MIQKVNFGKVINGVGITTKESEWDIPTETVDKYIEEKSNLFGHNETAPDSQNKKISSPETEERITRFTGQERALKCGKYICDDSGVFLRTDNGNKPICSHPITIDRRVVNLSDDTESLVIAFKRANKWKRQTVGKLTIASATGNGIISLSQFGVNVNSDNAKALSSFLMYIEDENYESIPTEISVNKLGWTEDKSFVPYDTKYVFEGEQEQVNIYNDIKPHGDREKWMSAILKMRQDKSPGRLYIAVSLSAVLIKPLGVLPFFFHTWGESGNGKTVNLKIASSVWAKPHIGTYITSFNSTNVGMELTASFLNSLPMCIDELQIRASAGEQDFNSIIYQLTEGKGRTRGTKTGGLQNATTWANCFITTGEQPITSSNSGSGVMNRVINFELKEKSAEDLQALCDILDENYGYLGKEFIDLIQIDGAIDSIKDYYRSCSSDLSKRGCSDKQASSLALILTADTFATEGIFKDDNGLTVDDMAELMTSKCEINVNYRTMDFIKGWIASNMSHFVDDSNRDYIPNEIYGKIESDEIYIIDNVLDKALRNEGYSLTPFMSWASDNGIIKRQKNRLKTYKSIKGVYSYTVCFIKKPFKAETGTELIDKVDTVNIVTETEDI